MVFYLSLSVLKGRAPSSPPGDRVQHHSEEKGFFSKESSRLPSIISLSCGRLGEQDLTGGHHKAISMQQPLTTEYTL